MGMTSLRGTALIGLVLITGLAFAASASASEGVYVANGNSDGAGGISQFMIGAGGGLAVDTPATQNGGYGPEAFVIAPNGEYAYAANGRSEPGVSQFTIGAGGTLTPDSPAAVDGGGGQLAVSPDGRYLYATTAVLSGDNGLYQYPIGVGGKLGTPVTINTGADAAGVAVTPNGSYVYVVNQGDSISEYTVAANGALSLHATSAAGQLNNPQAIAITPNGQDVYVVNPESNSTPGANGIEQYTVGAGGTLVADSTPVAATGETPDSVAVSPNGEYVYVTDQNGVSQFTVGSGGMLARDTPSEVAAGSTPTGIAVSPDGRYAYVTNSDSNNISQYTIGSTGLLTPNGTLPATSGGNPVPNSVAVAPDAGPTAAFTAAPAQTGAASTFTSTSTDADEPITSETWNFGDGTTGTGSPVTHVYATPGVYPVTLAVNDAAGCANAYPFFPGDAGPFTGQLSACSPGAVTTASETVTIPGPGSPSFGAVKVKIPKVTIIVGCAGIAIQTCTGTLALTTVEHFKGHKLTAISAKQRKPKKTTKTVTLGSATYSVAGGTDATLTITLNANGKKLLSKRHKLPAKLGLIPTGVSVPSTTKTLTITPGKAKHKHRR
jgi:DNA-binding beta-propeller fold protein YncE